MKGFRLPVGKFTEDVQRTWERVLREADRLNFKRNQDIELDADTRLVIQSPNGTRYRLFVDDSGNLEARSVVDGLSHGGASPAGFDSGFDAGFG